MYYIIIYYNISVFKSVNSYYCVLNKTELINYYKSIKALIYYEEPKIKKCFNVSTLVEWKQKL